MTTTDPLLALIHGPRWADGDLAAVYGLSHRQVQILLLVAAGETNAEIGRRLYLTEATVHTHLGRAYGVAKVRNRQALVDWGYRRKILRGRDEAAS